MKKWLVIGLIAYYLTINTDTGKLISDRDTSKEIVPPTINSIEVEVTEEQYNDAIDAINEPKNPYNQDTEFNNDGTIKKQYNKQLKIVSAMVFQYFEIDYGILRRISSSHSGET